MTEPESSLTLDVAARERATATLSANLNVFEFRTHRCSDWQEDGLCAACWDIAAAVLRAAESLRECPRCHGSGDVGGWAAVCCDECGGNGLEPLPQSAPMTEEEQCEG